MTDDQRDVLESGREAAETPSSEITEFLKHIGNRPCEACGKHRWYPLSKRRLIEWDVVGEPDTSIPLLLLVCGNCGNTRTFVWSRISYYLSKEKAHGEK
ncbi:TPA: hypothetical protein L4592_005977 [Pseudomonas aeruginosa]|nr:hypothetical protein [Pseudomonas aeruginosa]MCO3023490.1 hypothetical protein [Pseudomonas aeruginosa]HBO5663991.1 hypothetical protein [Pseudomonas aeruginosa]HBP1100940.1 hypothetical protein [Pseudomonas aeruginosa]HBP1261029.1 hypothetical protein [Pseudomonas aeruginosa]